MRLNRRATSRSDTWLLPTSPRLGEPVDFRTRGCSTAHGAGSAARWRAPVQPTRRPWLADCAPSGRMRLDALARWLQDVAYADVEDAGVADQAAWGSSAGTRLSVARFPRFAESFTVVTFCSGMGRMWAERRTTIRRDQGGGAADVEAVALWVHLRSRQPRADAPHSGGAERLRRHSGITAGPGAPAPYRARAGAAAAAVDIPSNRVPPRRPREQRGVLGASGRGQLLARPESFERLDVESLGSAPRRSLA